MALMLVWLSAVMAGLSGFLFGYDSGIITTTIAQEQFLLKFRPSSAMIGTIVSMMQVGGFFGCLMGGKVSDLWGRKKAIMFGCVFVLVGGAFQAAAPHVAMLIVGRVISGFGIGSMATTVPVYQAEISPPRWRATVVGCQQLMLALGSVSANWTGYGCGFVHTSFQWRMPLALQVVPGIVLLVGVSFLPESPRWLVERGARDAALRVVEQLRFDGTNAGLVQAEFQEIMEQSKKDKAEAQGRWHLQIWRKKSWRKQLFLGAGIWLMMNCTGINTVQFYMTIFISALGYTGQMVLLWTGIYACTGAGAILAFLFFVHHLSRKKPLIIGNLLLAAILAVLAALTGSPSLGEGGRKGGLAMLFMFFIVYSGSWAPLAWVYPAEMFPTQIRSLGYSISSAVNWVCNVMLIQSSPVGLQIIGWRYYFVYVATNLVSAVVLYFWYPETSGRSLEQMDEVFGSHGEDHELMIQPSEVRRDE